MITIILMIGLLMTVFVFVGCSSDDDSDTNGSSLKMNGMSVKIYNGIEGDWDSRYGFDFWVNGLEVLMKNDGVYIQATISQSYDDMSNESLTINVGEDITDRFGIDLVYKQGDGYISGAGRDNDSYNTYLSGTVKVKGLDKDKRILTLEFNTLTYDSTNDDDTSVDKITLTGNLVIPYRIIME